MTTYICQGSDENDATKHLRSHAAKAEDYNWTINSAAVPGDLCVFYMLKPTGAFVATGIVASSPERNGDRRSPWFGMFMADVANIEMLPAPISLALARDAFPEWRYLVAPRRSGTVPADVERRFLKFLHAALPGSQTDSGAIEGLRSELKRMTTSRSRALRDRRLAMAAGQCECCKEDFGSLLDGLGLRGLQVHHREQIAARTCPAVTTLDQLAVVCANCHAMIHADPTQAAKVETLARRLARARRA